MIAGIDSQADLEVYLEPEEIEMLGRGEVINGVLIKVLKPKRQGAISISVNEERKNENGFGIGIDDSGYWRIRDGFRLEVFLSSEWYASLRGRGLIGIRQRMLDGSKIHIYDRSRLTGLDMLAPENLEFYRDNKERLCEDLG